MQQGKPKSNLKMNPKFEVAYQGKMFEVVRWEGKPGVMFEAAVRAPGTRILIECEKDGKPALLMTRELRREAGGWDYRLPGGKVFDTLTEFNTAKKDGADISAKAHEAAIKEAREEAGASGGTFEHIETSKAGASVEWDLHYFVAKGVAIGEQELEKHEQGDIETIKLSAREIFEKLTNREIKEGRSADILWWWLSKNGYVEFKDK